MSGLDEFQMLLGHLACEELEGEERFRFCRQRQDLFEIPEKNFIKLFRVNKEMANDIIHCLEPHMKDCTRASALTAEEKVLIIFFYV